MGSARTATGNRGRDAAAAMFAGVVAVSAQAAFGESADRGPIRIEGCSVNQRSFLLDPFNSQRVNLVSGIALRFVDDRGVAATRVELSVRYEGSTQRIAASGTFASGQSIDRSDGAFAGTAYTSATAHCRVTWAAFADGSTWSAGP